MGPTRLNLGVWLQLGSVRDREWVSARFGHR